MEKNNQAQAPRKEKRQRRRRKFSFVEFLIIAVPTVAALITVFVVMFATQQETGYVLPDSGRQYYGGASSPVAKDTALGVTEEGNVIFSQKGEETTLPIYLDNSRAVVLTTSMTYYMPRSAKYAGVMNFSEIRCSANGMVHVTRNGKTETPEAGFLYDGKDFYLFLEPVEITYMGYTVNLPSLSYAEVRNGGDIMLFNYETKEFTIRALEGVATAKNPHGDFSISLLGDSMTDTNGKLTLLVTKPKEIEPLV